MAENIFEKALISDEEWAKVLISRVNARPNAKSSYGTANLNADQMKALFDEQGNLLKERHNLLAELANAEEKERREAEFARTEAEFERKEAEKIRVQNDISRGEIVERLEALVGDIDKALDELHNYAQALIGGGAV